MLLETVLEEWNATSGGSSPGEPSRPAARQSSYERAAATGKLEWRGSNAQPAQGSSSRTTTMALQVRGDVEEDEEGKEEEKANRSTPSTREEEAAAGRKDTRSLASPREEATSSRNTVKENRSRPTTPERLYHSEEGASLESWEQSPVKPRMGVQDSRSLGVGSRSSHSERPPLPVLPPALPLPLPPHTLRQIIAVAGPRSVRTTASPSRAAKSNVAGERPARNVEDVGGAASSPESRLAAPDFWGSDRREDVDRETGDSSYDSGEGASPMSDVPQSPLSVAAPSHSPRQQQPLQQQESGGSSRHGAKLEATAKSSQARAPSSSHWTNNLMSEELPPVMEEDEEEVDSTYGYHTMEFKTMESSPSTSEDRRDSRASGREGVTSSKSLSAPNSRQNSSLRPAAANRGRRRSDFDWPEDFEERPEEVVKEVDESLWAFSPVRSTFVFSGNDAADNRGSSNGAPAPATGTRTPPGSSPGLGSVLEHISLKSLARSASKLPHLKSPKSDHPGKGSSRLKHYGDDDFVSPSPRGHASKKSYTSCLPFFSLCSAQRPTTISFSQRLGPTLSNLNNPTLDYLHH